MSAPVISAQVPNPGLTSVSLRPQVSFDLTCDRAMNRAALRVYVDGVLAVSGQAYQAGYVPTVDFNNPGGISYFGGDTFGTFTVQPSAFLAANHLTSVRVVAEDDLGNTLDTTWTFTTISHEPNPYAINVTSDPQAVASTIYDPLRFTLIAEPVLNGHLVNAELQVNLGFGVDVIINGVPQAGYDVHTTPVTGGILYEIVQTGTPWQLGNSYPVGIHAAANNDNGEHTTANINFQFTPRDPAAPNPFDGGTVDGNLTGAYCDILSSLGAPTVATIGATRNADPAVSVWAGAAFHNGWAGSFVPGDPGPFPNSQNQAQRTALTPPASYLHNGDTIAFAAVGSIVSPDTGVTYPIAAAWNWLVSIPPPSVTGKKYAIETPDPFTFIVRTSLDGAPTDCDFTMGIWDLGILE